MKWDNRLWTTSMKKQKLPLKTEDGQLKTLTVKWSNQQQQFWSACFQHSSDWNTQFLVQKLPPLPCTATSMLVIYFPGTRKAIQDIYMIIIWHSAIIQHRWIFLSWDFAPCTKGQHKKAHSHIETLTFFTNGAILNKRLHSNIPENLGYVFCFKEVSTMTNEDIIQLNWRHGILNNNSNWSYK